MTEPTGPRSGSNLMCPSTTTGNATVFLGMISAEGRVAYVTPEIAVTSRDIMELPAQPGRTLESQYRLAGPCVESGCGHWSGGHCWLGEEVAAARPGGADPPTGLPKCAIRHRCRWFAEQGANACQACAYVVTDPSGHNARGQTKGTVQ